MADFCVDSSQTLPELGNNRVGAALLVRVSDARDLNLRRGSSLSAMFFGNRVAVG